MYIKKLKIWVKSVKRFILTSQWAMGPHGRSSEISYHIWYMFLRRKVAGTITIKDGPSLEDKICFLIATHPLPPLSCPCSFLLPTKCLPPISPFPNPTCDLHHLCLTGVMRSGSWIVAAVSWRSMHKMATKWHNGTLRTSFFNHGNHFQCFVIIMCSTQQPCIGLGSENARKGQGRFGGEEHEKSNPRLGISCSPQVIQPKYFLDSVLPDSVWSQWQFPGVAMEGSCPRLPPLGASNVVAPVWT